MLSDEQIAELRRLLDAATPGHWTTEKPTRDHDGWATGVAICCVARGQCVYSDTQGGSMPESDRQLIATLRNAAPALLSAHDDAVRLREALDRVRMFLQWMADYEKSPPEIVKDDFAYDRLMSWMKRSCGEWARECRAALRPAGQGGG